MKLFVTGGAGFIGSNFIRYWLTHHADDSVVNYDALTYAGCLESLNDVASGYRSRYSFVRGDIREYPTLLDAMRAASPDIVINFAAESHNSRAILDPGIFVETNVLGTQRLLEACRTLGIKRFHHISTCEVYGDLPLDSPDSFSENAPYRPRTPYNASKAAADMIVRAYHITYGLPITISNCANNYGPYQFPEKVIPHFTIKALQRQKLPLYKQSRNKREWIHVLDHCAALDLILTRGVIGETYNIGTGVEADVEAVADAVLEHFKLDQGYKQYVADRPSHDRRYLLDSRKIRAELGWRPAIAFESGIQDAIQWYADNEWWWKPLLARLSVKEDTWK